MRQASFCRGFLIGYAQMALSMVVGIWLARFLLKHIGQHDYGMWLVIAQVTGYLDFLDIGVVALLGRDVATAKGRAASIEEATDIPPLIARTVRVLALQTPLIILTGVGVYMFMPGEWHAVKAILVVLFVGFIVFFPFRVLHVTLEALQDLQFLGGVGFFGWTVSIVATIVLVLCGFGINVLVAGVAPA